jgi:hypothetical protein
MSSTLAHLIESLSPDEQQAVESLIRQFKNQRIGPPAATTPNRGFPFGAGAKNPLVHGTQAEQDRLWRAMTSKEADDFYEGRY